MVLLLAGMRWPLGGISFTALVAQVFLSVGGPGALRVLSAAQQPGLLSPGIPVTAEAFDSATAIVVLSAGTLVIADPRARQVYIVNPATGVRQVIGRQGDGPGEYRAPVSVHRLRGDTIAIYDVALRRFALFDRNGRAAGSLSPPRGLFFAKPIGSDTVGAGSLYFILRLPAGRPPVVPDSGQLVRWRLTGQVDTLALLRFAASVSTTRRVGERVDVILRTNAFAFSDFPLVGLNGTIAVLRGDPYRVDQVRPGGTVLGPAIEWESLRVTPADLEEFRLRRDGEYPWTRKGPLLEGTARMEGDSVIWGARHGPANRATIAWDRLTVAGVRTDSHDLPAFYRIAGFAPSGTIYVWRRDIDDLQWLERLPR
jgi:hypothetical protein